MRPRIVFEITQSEVTFRAYKDHIVAVVPIGNRGTVGLRFVSVEHILTFCTMLIEKAALTWPEHELIK